MWGHVVQHCIHHCHKYGIEIKVREVHRIIRWCKQDTYFLLHNKIINKTHMLKVEAYKLKRSQNFRSPEKKKRLVKGKEVKGGVAYLRGQKNLSQSSSSKMCRN